MKPNEEKMITNDSSSALFFSVDLLRPITAIRIGSTSQPRTKSLPHSNTFSGTELTIEIQLHKEKMF